MKAIVLVGGEGTRLRPLTCQVPKAMVPVLNRPFLEYVIQHLKKHSVDTIILTLCYLAENIRACFGDGSKYGVKMVYIEEKSPLGTAGAVKNAETLLDDSFFVLNGDVLTDLNFTDMLRMHRKKHSVVSIALTPVDDPTVYGVVETERGGRIRRFVEKPKANEVTTNMINAGTYILEPGVLHNIPADTPFSFERQLFPLLLNKGEPLFAYPTSAFWIDIGTPDKYMKLNRELLTRELAARQKMPHSRQGIEIGRGSVISPTCKIEGYVIIGESSYIGDDTVIKGPTIIGDSCRIGSGTRLESVILWNGVAVGKNARLSDCIVASNCVVSDNSCVGLGCVMGDNVTVAPDCVISPGSKIWPGTLVS